MKPVLPIILFALLATACTRYQYTALKSDLNKNTDDLLYFYSDSNTYIDFAFYGKDFPVHISIENTGSRDLLIDLSKSLFTVNDVIVATAIQNSKTTISGNFIGVSTDVLSSSNFSTYVTSGSIHATAITQNYSDLVYIPSGKKVKLTYRPFSSSYTSDLKKNSPSKVLVSGDSTQYATMYFMSEQVAPRYGIRLFIVPDSPDASGYPIECEFVPNAVLTTTTPPQKFWLKNPALFYNIK